MAPQDDNPRVFDISKPNRFGPDPTGRPIIPGHHPMMPDPLIKRGEPPRVTSVPVMSDEDHTAMPGSGFAAHPADPFGAPGEAMSPGPEENLPSPFTPIESLIDPHSAGPAPALEGGGDNSHLIGNLPLPNAPGAGPGRLWRSPLTLIVSALVLLFALYAILDAMTSVALPFHIFRKTTPVSQTTSAPAAPANQSVNSTQPTIPAGFTQYKIAGTTVIFAYPTAWGTPTASPDLGYTKRGGTNKSDGTYAYLVNFASNKDVQAVVTSSKYLPPIRASLYYDFIQLCIGTSDAKYYKSLLHFSTTDKIDTPTTITCDQGPLTDATKLNDSTIVQLKTKGSDGKTVLGDLYTTNIADKDYPVLRVKDATMTNAANIKTLISSIRVSTQP